MNDDYLQILKDYAFKVLSFRPRSIFELRQKINLFSRKHKIPLDYTDKAISELIQKNFLNDKEFSRWWINQRQEFKQKGKKLIRLELLAKGIGRKTVDEVLNENGKEDETALAKKAVSKRVYLWERLPELEFKKKISVYLSRRGFDWETVSRVIDYFLKKE